MSSSRTSDNRHDINDDSSGQENENINRDFRATTVIPNEIRLLLRTRNVRLHARTHYKEVVLSTFRCHPGNSQILFRPVDYNFAFPIPAIINYICEFSDGSIKLIVREVSPSPRGEVDKYAVYLDFPARRISSKLSDNFRVIDLTWVESQFFSWKEDEDHMVIIPVSPVSQPFCFQKINTLTSRF